MPAPELIPAFDNRPAWLDDLQGNTLKGHGRDHTLHVFLHFANGRSAELRDRIQRLAVSLVTPMSRQLDESKQFNEFGLPGRLFVNYLLTASGYSSLGFAGNAVPADASFRRGMKDPQTRATLQDPASEEWEPGFAGRIDAMVLLADDDPEYLGRQARELLTEYFDGLASVVAVEKGTAIRNKRGETIEHFGYVDGRSQPIYFREDHLRERKEGGVANWDPSAPIDLILVPDPNAGPGQPPLGTYFVFRKLEQNVREFKRAERETLASVLQLVGEEAERAGAMVVGRFEDGTPVTMQRGDGVDDPVLNNFNYKDDALGSRCPFHAHVRKVNPRNFPGAADDLPFSAAAERSRRITRRGITYGTRSQESLETDELDQLPSGEVGLLFMCCQASLAEQFEFMQQSWANNPDFPPGQPSTGVDPIIGQIAGNPPTPPHSPTLPQQWPTEWGEEDFQKRPKAPFGFGGFVRMLGGEYFFVPSLVFLRQIVNPPAPIDPSPPAPGQPGYP